MTFGEGMCTVKGCTPIWNPKPLSYEFYVENLPISTPRWNELVMVNFMRQLGCETQKSRWSITSGCVYEGVFRRHSTWPGGQRSWWLSTVRWAPFSPSNIRWTQGEEGRFAVWLSWLVIFPCPQMWRSWFLGLHPPISPQLSGLHIQTDSTSPPASPDCRGETVGPLHLHDHMSSFLSLISSCRVIYISYISYWVCSFGEH